jgi:hypothetical protein
MDYQKKYLELKGGSALIETSTQKIDLSEYGCGVCSLSNYDNTKIIGSNLYVMSYVLFATGNHVNVELNKIINDPNFKVYTQNPHVPLTLKSPSNINNTYFNLLNYTSIDYRYMNKYTTGLLNIGNLAEKIYPNWIIRLYYDDSLLNQNNKKLYEIIFEWLNSKKNFQLIKYNFDDYKAINEEHSSHQLFGTITRMFPLFDESVDIVALRDIDSMPLEKDNLILNDFLASDKLIHVYEFGYHPTYISCPLGGYYKDKYNYKFDELSSPSFPMGLTTIKNKDKRFNKEHIKILFKIITDEEKFINSLYSQLNINKYDYLDDNKHEVLINNWNKFLSEKKSEEIKFMKLLKDNIPISLCLSTEQKYTENIKLEDLEYTVLKFWNFGTDESLLNLLLYYVFKDIKDVIFITKTFSIDENYFLNKYINIKDINTKIKNELTKQLKNKSSEYYRIIFKNLGKIDIEESKLLENNNSHKIFIEELMPYN